MHKIKSIIILLCLTGCTTQLLTGYKEATTRRVEKNISYTTSFDSTYAFDIKHFYNLRWSSKQLASKNYTLFYNKKIDYYFDLCTGEMPEHYTRIRPAFIDSAFIKGEQSIYAVYLHNFDSLFAITEKNIYLFDTSGKVINTVSYLESKNKNYTNYELNFDQNEKPFYYSSATKNLYISVFNNRINKGSKEVLKKNAPIVLQYNIASNTWTENKLTLSELFRNRDYYIANQYFTNYVNNSIILNFEVDPNIYIYNILTDTVEVYGGRSAFADSIPTGFDNQSKYTNDELFTWFTRIPRYESKLLYDPYKRFYYRLFFKSLDLKNKEGLYNTQWDKVPVLMVFDEQFNLLKEFELPAGKIVGKKPFVTEKGLHLDLRTTSEDKPKKYMIITVK